MAQEQVERALKNACDTRVCVIGEGALGSVAETFRAQFPESRRAVVICDPRTKAAAGERVGKLLASAGVEVSEHVLEPSGAEFHADYRYVAEVKAAVPEGATPVAVGSGVVNDLTKRAAGELGVPYMVVATAASVDGYSSFGAALRSPEGAKQTYACPAPRAIVADLDVIRTAPSWMAASGYADLLAKVPAGADWILAHELGAAEWHDRAWHVVQDGLAEALGDPEGVRAMSTVPLTRLVEGLMLGGFAMQDMQCSRPASGAEHMFSHILEMRNHTFRGKIVPHGIQVGVFTRYMCALYEQILAFDYSSLDVEKCVAQWPGLAEAEARAKELFVGTPFPDAGVKTTRAKWVGPEVVRERLESFAKRWPEIRRRLEGQLISSVEAERRLKVVGAPAWPEEIGTTRERSIADVPIAQNMRDRYNALDFLAMTGQQTQFVASVWN